jgi:hypothetical protein
VVIGGPCRLIAPSARSVSARAWSKIAFSSVIRSFSIRSVGCVRVSP